MREQAVAYGEAGGTPGRRTITRTEGPLSTSLVLAVAVVVLVAVVSRLTRSRPTVSTDRLRSEWGSALPGWRDLGAIRGYHDWRAENGPSEYVDDRTWEDLHLDLVFDVVDRTRSTVGRQSLYHRLRSTPDEGGLQRFSRAVQHFTDHESERDRAQVLLSRLSHAAGYRLWSICRPEAISVQWWYATFPVLAATAVASLFAYPFWPRALLVLLAVSIINIVLRVRLHWRIHHLLAPFRQIAPLLDCAEYMIDPSVAGDERREVLESLERLRPLRSAARWASREFSMENELIASGWEYLNVLFLLDANAMLLATRTLRECGDDLLRVVEFVGDVDAAISTASWRAGAPRWCTPRFSPPGEPTVIVDATHPIVEEAVPNSIRLHPGRGLIITGSNMSGKSTFLRTVGSCVILAQSLDTCPASSYTGPRMKVKSAIGRSDDLAAGKSYYLVEVEAVLGMVHDSTSDDQHLFLFDELFRGTNTIERLAAGEAVLSALPRGPDGVGRHIVIAATHDIELVEMLADGYDPFHFHDSVEAAGLSFDFVIRPGPARTRNAIALLESRGAPPDIVVRARATVDRLDGAKGPPGSFE